MATLSTRHQKPLIGILQVPGDKSISHRALILSALCQSPSTIYGLSTGADVQSTRTCLEAMGINITPQANGSIRVDPQQGLRAPETVLDCGNSGTTMRLLTGLLASQQLYAVLTGDASLRKRPMGRIITPLSQMGAQIIGRSTHHLESLAPLTLLPAPEALSGITYTSPVASAQVKSAVLLAGLFAQGVTQFSEPSPSRDHTERMLGHLGIGVLTCHDKGLNDSPAPSLRLSGLSQANRFVKHLPAEGTTWQIPGDFSSAAFFIMAALLIPGSALTIQNVSLNPLRTGLLQALVQVEAPIEIQNHRLVCGEPVGDLYVNAQPLQGNITILPEDVPGLIDELPILAIACSQLNGTLTVTGAEELRKKESDRIEAIATELGKLGVAITVFADGFQMTGDPERRLEPSQPLNAHHDHRIAMALRILNCIQQSLHPDTTHWPIDGEAWASISYPDFLNQLHQLTR